MTAHDTNLPSSSSDPAATPGLGATHTGRHRDRAAVIVWRITADRTDVPDLAAAPDAGDSPLTSRLAHHLVAIYSDEHGTVIDFDTDVNVCHAAQTTARHYRAVTNPVAPGAPTEQIRPAALIMLRWPRPATTPTGQDATSLLTTCRQHLANDGSTIIVVTAPTAGTTDSNYRTHEQVLLAAAETAGLHHLHDIIPLDAENGQDTFTYQTNPNTTTSQDGSNPDTPWQTSCTTLKIFGHPERRP